MSKNNFDHNQCKKQIDKLKACCSKCQVRSLTIILHFFQPHCAVDLTSDVIRMHDVPLTGVEIQPDLSTSGLFPTARMPRDVSAGILTCVFCSCRASPPTVHLWSSLTSSRVAPAIICELWCNTAFSALQQQVVPPHWGRNTTSYPGHAAKRRSMTT